MPNITKSSNHWFILTWYFTWNDCLRVHTLYYLRWFMKNPMVKLKIVLWWNFGAQSWQTVNPYQLQCWEAVWFEIWDKSSFVLHRLLLHLNTWGLNSQLLFKHAFGPSTSACYSAKRFLFSSTSCPSCAFCWPPSWQTWLRYSVYINSKLNLLVVLH